MSLLRIEKLTKFYDDFKALDEVSMTIREHEVYGFIGRNGAGKTTTINVVLSLLNKDSGHVFFEGEEIGYDDVRYKQRIGYVPDVPSFPNFITAKEFLRFAYDSYGLPALDRETRIEEVFAIVGLEDSPKRIGGYSRGMKQRLAIGQALIHKPELLIMDEPTSALDPIGRKDVIDIIRKLKHQMTVFYSTHILEDAQKVCDRIGFIEQGKILFEDTMANIMKTHHTVGFHMAADIEAESLLAELEASHLVSDAKLHEDGVIYTLKDDRESKKLLVYLVEKGIEVKTLKKQERSLEDVFIEVLHENHR